MRFLLWRSALFLFATAAGCTLEFDPTLIGSGPGGCKGCNDGVRCLAGDAPTACGLASAKCAVCIAPADGCFDGRCVLPHAVVEVSASGDNTAVIDRAGALWIWGDNTTDQLGMPGQERDAPAMLFANGWAHVAVGAQSNGQACAISAAGALFCWGLNQNGEAGVGSFDIVPAPLRVGTASDWSAVAVEQAMSCGIRAPGSLWCWGWNGDARLGYVMNAMDHQTTPAQVGTDTTWAALSLGAAFGCALTANGTLFTWGNNGSGKLGRGGDAAPPAPVAMVPTSWKQVAAGGDHACGIRLDGSLWCWGDNTSGQLGLPSSVQVPTRVDLRADWAQVTAGSQHSCAVRTDGTLHCWGSNMDGQLGLGAALKADTPTQVGTSADWLAVEAGQSHTCAIRRDGALFCFGFNGHGEVGNGGGGVTNTPTLIALE